jgi:amino acid adenylation domain-containing protein
MSKAPQIEAVYPLTPMQEGMIFHTLEAPGSGVYVEQLVCSIEGELALEPFRRAWERAVERHGVLRTCFAWKRSDQPHQVVLRRVDSIFRHEDWRERSADEQRAQLCAFLDGERRRGFDLARAPLMRVTLVRTADRSWRLVCSHHHAILDGWSGALLLGEVLGSYRAFREGREPELAPVRPYREFIAWLQGRDAAAAEAFWRAELRGFEAPTQIGLAPPAGGAEIAGPRRVEKTRLSAKATEALQRLAREHRLTPSTIVQGAWALLLARYAGEEDVVFGATVSGRPPELPGAERMVGLFINTLPVRVRLRPETTVAAWLEELQARQLEARQHEHTPLVRIREWSEVPRRQPLFESLVVFESYPVDASLREVKGDLSIEVQETASRTNYPLVLLAAPGAELALNIAYDEGRFDAASVGRMLGHLHVLLEGMAADSRRPLRELPLLTEAERRQVLVEWNRTEADHPRDRCVHELFEEQAGRTPDAVALVYEGVRLTYAELNARANRLAHHLVALGVKPDTLVAIGVERSLEMVVGLLAILKAGGAYVPLDPSYPAERLEFMLEDSAPRALLTQASLRERWSNLPGTVAVLELDGEASAWEQRSSANLDPHELGLASGNLAYVIYTSGSTGKPKGAMNEHRAVVNRLLWMQDAYRLDGRDAVLQKTPFSFDVSVWEFFWPLLAGARLVMARPGGHQDPSYLADVIRREGISTLHFVPSMLQVFLEHGDPASCTTVSRLVCSGEALPAALAERVHEVLPGTNLYNLYGPTEAAVDVTAWTSRPGYTWTSVPIGRPIANTQIYILDAHGQPVPIGVAGELYIGGAGVGRGYLNRSELTAERFIADPFVAVAAGEPLARMYRTGDLGRWLPDGSIEFLGRNDFQVKVRGVRIELGEIEAALARHPGVEGAAVVAREEGATKRLVAYTVARDPESPPTAAELREHLREKLPEQMVPSAFVALPALPLAPNGKLDRRALPEPEPQERGAEGLVAPRTPLEEILAGLYAHVLGAERVGVHDDFFELGGHSLSATRLVSRVRDALKVELPLRALFESPTVAGLAEAVAREQKASRPELPPLVAAPREGEIPPSFAQQRLWFLDQLLPGSTRYNVPVALRLEGRLDAEALRRSLDEIVRRHEVLRTTFASAGGRPVQVIAPELRLDLPIVDLGSLPEAEREARVRRLVDEEAGRPFDLERGPLLRVKLLRLSDEEHVAVLVMHHVVSDGWSVGVLVRELGALYGAFSQGEPSPLSELAIQYADYARWQRSWLTGPALEAEIGYWKRELAGCPPLLELPTDRPRPVVATDNGASFSFAIPAPLCQALTRLGQREGATPFMTLLAAFEVLLSRTSGQADFCVGTPIANRTRSEIEGLVGFFVNTLVMRADLSGDASFRDHLVRVRERALGAYGHQDVPFEMLVEALEPRRALSHSPLFQVMFTMGDTSAGELRLPGLALSQVPVKRATSTFDLTLSLSPGPEGLQGTLEYNADLFDEATVARMAGHFRTLLAAIAADPDRRVSALALMGEEERRRVLVEWNRTEADYPRERCVHELFEEQVGRAPDAPAVVSRERSLSYRELDRRANRIAHQLRAAGIRPGMVVGLVAERSAEAVAALLAVLKAGAAYLPLDPGHPRERLAFMLADARAPLVIAQERTAGLLPQGGPRALLLDADAAEIEAQPDLALRERVTADDLAYVMYTSGSTGVPKGVQVQHRSINRLVLGIDYARLGPDRTLLHAAPLAFDASTFEIWGALLHGGRCAIHHEQVPTARELGESIRRHGITTAFLTTALFNALVDEDASQLSGLSELLTGGEAVSVEHVRRALAALPGTGIMHVYGPTETTTFASCHRVPRELAARAHSIPIGRPIANTTCYVLDGRQGPAPVGVFGELYIGGDGVARGYLERPELTGERFLPDPFSARPGARMYRTGDRVRWLPGGAIEFMGRLDDQVKIRGFRIEPGEIEVALSRHPALREAAVLARQEGGDRRLVAYVVPRDPANPPKVGELRAFLKESLPDYMVPAAILSLPALPVTANGKVDRNALPAPEASRPEERPYVAPRTPAEETLARLCAELLGLERVGVEDDFFELGGHSLLATQLLSRLRATFRVELPLRALFESPTVAGLAAAVEGASSARQSREAEVERLLEKVEQLSPEKVRAFLESRAAAQGEDEVGSQHEEAVTA